MDDIFFSTFVADLGYYMYIEASIPRVEGQYADIMSPPLIMASNTSTVEVKTISCNFVFDISELSLNYI